MLRSLAILVLFAAAASAQSQPSSELPRYQEVSPKVGTGGQPTPRGLELLKEKGYTAVINLRTANEGVDLAAEEKRARELGLQYYGIPVVSSDPKPEQADEFLRLFQRLSKDRVYVHCAAASRVGGFLMIRWALDEGMPLDEAEAKAKQVGLQSEPLRKFARAYVESHKKK